jgi:hypothetical protein
MTRIINCAPRETDSRAKRRNVPAVAVPSENISAMESATYAGAELDAEAVRYATYSIIAAPNANSCT